MKSKIIIPIGIAIIVIALSLIFTRFAPTKTTDVGTMISTAQQYLTEQKYEQAIAKFQKIIEIDPKNADAYIGLAKAYIGQGDDDKAVEVLEDGYNQTGDARILEMLEELKTGDETSAETAKEAIETEIVEIETTENAKIEQIRQQALDILSPYAPNKNKGEPNSTFYAYFDGAYGVPDWYECFKCEYDENGDLKNEYFTRIMSGFLDGNIQSGSNRKMFKRLNDGNYAVCEGTSYWQGINEWYKALQYDTLISISENEYKDKFDQITIHTDNDMVTEIEGWGVSLTYNSELSEWASTDYSSPYIIGLPDGYDDSIFGFDESKVEKIFTDYDEYYDYINNN